jgi:hypothetical protein
VLSFSGATREDDSEGREIDELTMTEMVDLDRDGVVDEHDIIRDDQIQPGIFLPESSASRYPGLQDVSLSASPVRVRDTHQPWLSLSSCMLNARRSSL